VGTSCSKAEAARERRPSSKKELRRRWPGSKELRQALYPLERRKKVEQLTYEPGAKIDADVDLYEEARPEVSPWLKVKPSVEAGQSQGA
jgi:hypothetical protein